MCPAWVPNCHSLFEIWWESLEGKVLTYCLARLPVELAFDLGMITKIDFLFHRVCLIVSGLGAVYVSCGLGAFIQLKFSKEASFDHVMAGLTKTFIRLMAKHFLNGWWPNIFKTADG